MINEKFGALPKEKGSEAIAPEKTVMERSRLWAREAALVNDLRHEILIMPEPKAVTDSAAESAWLANRDNAAEMHSRGGSSGISDLGRRDRQYVRRQPAFHRQ